MQQLLRELEVELHHHAPVPFGGRRAGALVEHADDLRGEILLRHDPAQEIVALQVIGDAAAGEIDRLAAVGEVVHDHDVGDAGAVQALHDVGADEAGAAGDDDHVLVAHFHRCREAGPGKPRCSAPSWRSAEYAFARSRLAAAMRSRSSGSARSVSNAAASPAMSSTSHSRPLTPRLDDLRDAADAGRHHRQAERHGIEQDRAEALVAGRIEKDVEGGQIIPDVADLPGETGGWRGPAPPPGARPRPGRRRPARRRDVRGAVRASSPRHRDDLALALVGIDQRADVADQQRAAEPAADVPRPGRRRRAGPRGARNDLDSAAPGRAPSATRRWPSTARRCARRAGT